MLGRACSTSNHSLPHLPSRPPRRSDYSDPLRWSRGRSRQPSAALRAVYDGRAPVTGTRLKARLLLRTVPGARPSSRTGARALPPRSFLADLDCSSPVFRPKTTRLPHQVCHLDRLGLLPKPGLRACGFSFAGSLQILVPCPTETAPAKPETCGFRLVCLDVFSGSRSAWRHWAAPRCALSQMVASSRFWLRPTGSPSKRATSLFRGWAVVISTLAQKRRSGPLMAFAGLLLCGALPRPLGCNGGGGHDSCCCPMLARCLLRVIHRLQWVHFGVDFCAMSLMLSASPDALGQVIHRLQPTGLAGSAGPKTQKAPSLGLRWRERCYTVASVLQCPRHQKAKQVRA